MKKTLLLLAMAASLCGCNNQDQKSEQEIAGLKDQLNEVEANQQAGKKALANLQSQITELNIDRVNDAERAGAISHDQAKQFKAELTGKIPMYVLPNGQLTTNQYSPVANGEPQQ